MAYDIERTLLLGGGAEDVGLTIASFRSRHVVAVPGRLARVLVAVCSTCLLLCACRRELRFR